MNEYYMNIAIKEAKKAYKYEEVPVGAVIVNNNKIIAKTYNKKEQTKNVTKHAEIIAISKACKKLKNWRLDDCEIYVTLEPCFMCMGAIVESRIKNVYCGTKNNKSNLYNRKICENENIKIEYGILENDINNQIKKFFNDIRKAI